MGRRKLVKPALKALTATSLLLGIMNPYGSNIVHAEENQTEFDFTKVPKLLITELVPDTANSQSKDAYEFIEVYNNSNLPVSFDGYSLNYKYDDGSHADEAWPLSSADQHPVIPAKSSIVFWVMNSVTSTLTPKQFSDNYQLPTALEEGKNLFRISGGGGMVNDGARTLYIKDSSGNMVVSASYDSTTNTALTNPNMGMFYSYPTDGSTNMTLATDGAYAAGMHLASPGAAESMFVPTRTPDDGGQGPELPQTPVTIAHTPVTDAIDDSDLELMAKVSPNGADAANVGATVYYKLNSESTYTALPMTKNPDRSTAEELAFEVAIPKERLTENKLQYYIEATDGTGTKDTEVYTANIRASMNYNYVPALLISELNPNSANVTVSSKAYDGYEFIEVYNNSNRTLNLSDYQLMYRYTDRTPNTETKWETGDVIIPSQQSVVLWISNVGSKTMTEADFNTHFGTNLKLGETLFKIENDGMANGGARSIVIKNAAGQEIVSAHYDGQVSSVEDKTIVYKYPDDGTTAMLLDSAGVSAASPGTLNANQVPKVAVSLPEEGVNEAPVITHTPVTHAETNVNLQITADITNKESDNGDFDPVSAQVFYKTQSQTAFTSIPMAVSSGHTYLADIPRSELKEAKLEYYIEVKDAKNTVKTDTYSVDVNVPDYDPQKVPPLLVTELVPNSTNVGSSDGYEFVELYNNSDKAVNLKDYKLYYRYTDSGTDADIVWPIDSPDENVMIEPGKAIVFWIINAANGTKTVADFNAFYHTSLVENKDIFTIHSDGMANTGRRGLVIGTNTHVDVSAAYYDGSQPNETATDKAIVYGYPTNGSTTMIKLSAGTQAPTPGSVTPTQAPALPVVIPDDQTKPTVNDLTGVTSIDQSKDLGIEADVQDNLSVKSVKLFYKTNKDADYASRYLYRDYNDAMYHFKLYSPDLIGKTALQYYFQVSDGTNEVTTDPTTIAIAGGPDRSPLRLNLKNGDIINGTKIVKGTAENAGPDTLQLSFDGKAQTQGTYHALEKDPFFAFDANSVNYYFKNGVTMGQEILYTFMDPINTYQTLSVPIDAGRLKEGDNVLSIRAGTKSSPFDDRPEENKDDFTVKNIRLVLADGTVIYDPKYANPVTELKMGDSAGKNPVVDFKLPLQASDLKSQAYDLDTTKLSDGEHTVVVENAAHEQVKATIKVDNTAPAVKPSLEDGKTYRGAFTINATITDNVAGLKTSSVTLDGKEIELPYATSSGKLSEGAHTLVIKAEDNVGNKTEKTVTFDVPNENPLKPELISPTSEEDGADPKLSVKVTDPTKDRMEVDFLKGYLYDASHRAGFSAFKNASDIEPPKMLKPEGETAFTDEDYGLISAADGQFLKNDSDEKFPYHRFEVNLDKSVKPTDSVEIEWKGKSLEGRKVSLYAWSQADSSWKMLDSKVAGNDEFELSSEVKAGDYAVDGTIHVMVQDELPVKQDDYDFSFVWMSDTQYYSESYPEIYEGNVQWIVDHKDDMNIKYVIHTGDIVDEADKEYQWQEADKDMKVLEDANIPYGVLAGNHDVSHQYADYTKFYQYFGENRFKKQPTYGGSYQNNRGHYDLISAGGNDFIVIYMGWDIRDEDIQWMDDVVKAYPDRKAILDFHEYLLVSDNRAPISEKIHERVVVPNKNVIAVLCGHYHDAEELVDNIDDNGDGVPDRKVYQLLADYQGAEKGGLGYIRLLQFDSKNNQIHVKTYSPYLDDYNYYDPTTYPGKDEFDLDVDLQPMHKQVATDYFGVKVYTNESIGVKKNVNSGGTASVQWNGLTKGDYYQWYAVAKDANSGLTRSDIWGFTAGKTNNGNSGTPTNPGNGGTPTIHH